MPEPAKKPQKNLEKVKCPKCGREVSQLGLRGHLVTHATPEERAAYVRKSTAPKAPASEAPAASSAPALPRPAGHIGAGKGRRPVVRGEPSPRPQSPDTGRADFWW